MMFVGAKFKTDVWVSHAVISALDRMDQHERRRFLAKLEYYAINGFKNFVGGEGLPIRSEGDGVFRVRHARSSLYRLIGFFEIWNERFIAIDFYLKKAQELSAAERARIREVASVKAGKRWRPNT